MFLYSILFLILGFFGLFFGSKFVIISLENIADRLNISHIMVGLTILSIGTSLPEIAVSVMGGFDKLLGIDPNIDGIVIGNKVGSFLTQITLIIGILAVSSPIFVFSLDGILTQFEAFIMIIIYIIYLALVIWSERHLAKAKLKDKLKADYLEKQRLDAVSFEPVESPRKESSTPRDIGILLIGLIILIIAAEATLLSAHDISKEFNIPENVVGILIVGFGTSLPELVADLTAIRRGSFGIAVGDILGSNICDILFASGAGAIIVNFNVPMIILVFDIPVLFLALALVLYLLWSEKTLKRWEGGLLIGFYCVYTIIKLTMFQI